MKASQTVTGLLRRYESRNVTYLDPDGTWPVVWERASGAHVWDAEGRKYLDLTAAFGVAAAGHANPRVVRAGQKQMSRLLHAMGDVHPHALKARLARELSALTFERWIFKKSKATNGGARGKIIFCNSGFEAVEAALKTAALATGRPGVIAFKDAYHGLGYGTLNATHREHFRGPFVNQLRQFGTFVSFPKTERDLSETGKAIEKLFKEKQRIRRRNGPSRIWQSASTRREFGAILVEPIQVRGGINIPPPGFLPMLRKLCDRFGALLILDEIYTGFGRTGSWFACEHYRTVPDLICLGKAMTGGFPLSACVGRADVMDNAWPISQGEAIHTSTFLGHPVGCAMALAQIQEIKRLNLPKRSAAIGRTLLTLLRSQLSHLNLQVEIRGMGLLVGVELNDLEGKPAGSLVLATIKETLQRGYILLPEGEQANVISFTPPLTISETQLRKAVHALARTLKTVASRT